MSLTISDVKRIVSSHALSDIADGDRFCAATADELKSPCSNHIDVVFMKKLEDGFHIEFGLKNSNIYK